MTDRGRLLVVRAIIALLLLVLGAWWFGRGYLADDFGLITMVQQAGFTDVEPLGPDDKSTWTAPLRCSDLSAVAYEVRAINGDGLPVEIVVCCGWPVEVCSLKYPR